jgi:hypothetical protein
MVKELEPEIFLFENVQPGKKKTTLELKVLLFKNFQPKKNREIGGSLILRFC